MVGEELLPQVRGRMGERAVLAVSPNGVVELVSDGPRWDAVFGEEESKPQLVIKPDLEKLDLDDHRLIPISELRATGTPDLAMLAVANRQLKSLVAS